MFLDFEENKKQLKKDNPKSLLVTRNSITEPEVLCESCKKSFKPKTILKHIGHVKACKTFYGPRYSELKKEQQRKRVDKFLSNLSGKQKRDALKKNRETYAKSSEKQKQKREHAEKTKQKKLDEIQRNYNEQQEKNAGNKTSKEEINMINFVENEAGKIWQCDFCKTFWPSASILKHIGNTKNCKSHYGPRFDDLKKESKRQRQECYRREEGIEKELEQQRKKYASDPKVKERKKKRQEMERNIRQVKDHVICKEKEARNENRTHFDYNEWIHDFFMHFFETFKEVCNQTKGQIFNLKESMDSVYIINEAKIDELAEEANLSVNDYKGEYPSAEVEISSIQAKIETKWYELKKTIGIRLTEIVDQVEESDKISNWYHSLKKLKDIYVDRESMYCMEKYFFEEKFCIICKDRAHRISFDPEQAARNKNYTYYGTSKYEKHGSFGFIIL